MLSNECSKVARYRIIAQKSLAFLYINNEKSDRKIKDTMSFSTATKRVKYLGIILPEETKHPYAENYETVMKEIKTTHTDGEIYHVLALEK